MKLQKQHSIDLDTFGFVTREKSGDKTVIFRCGRDFLYYALHFYFPNRYNPKQNSASELEKSGAFIGLPWWLMWTMVQFRNIPAVLKQEGVELRVNGRTITSWWQFVLAHLISKPPTFDEVMSAIDEAIDNGEAIGVDISIKPGGLVDHIMFVYGYDEDNLYVFDTNQVPNLPYKKVTDDDRFIMQLPKSVVKERLGRFSRVWHIKRTSSQSAQM